MQDILYENDERALDNLHTAITVRPYVRGQRMHGSLREHPALSWERLTNVLDYDPNTGVFVWKIKSGPAQPGRRAGNQVKRKYRTIMIDGIRYYEHQLAWFYEHKEWSRSEIDHRDTDPSNNRLNNLRPATESQNAANRRLGRNNTSGYKGVAWDRGKQRWMASIRVNRKAIFLGRFDDVVSAAAAYEAAAAKYFGKFARAA